MISQINGSDKESDALLVECKHMKREEHTKHK